MRTMRLPFFGDGWIAQLVEQRIENPCVPGSIPGPATIFHAARFTTFPMVDSSTTITLPGLEDGRRADEPCTIVIFGASGDLTARKLIPALYHLYTQGQMPESFRVVGVARREKTDESWRAEMRAGVETYSRTRQVDDVQWDAFAANLAYHLGDLTDADAYAALAKRLAGLGDPCLVNNLVFYLAISPSLFGEVVDQLHAADLLHRMEAVSYTHLTLPTKA